VVRESGILQEGRSLKIEILFSSFFLSIYVEIMEALDIFEGPPFLD